MNRVAITSVKCCRVFGLILGTLGRQGNIRLYDRLRDRLNAEGRSVILLLMAEINPLKLAKFADIEVDFRIMSFAILKSFRHGFKLLVQDCLLTGDLVIPRCAYRDLLLNRNCFKL
jgi:hypothetical protein